MVTPILIAYFSTTLHALPSDFAGLKLAQKVEATQKFLSEKGFNVVYPDGKIVNSAAPKPNQLCTVTMEPLLPKSKLPAIQSFTCGVTKAKDPSNGDRVIDTYIINHFLHEKVDEKAFYLTFMFNLKTIKPAGAGLIGKMGEPDTVNANQACPPFIIQDLKLKKNDNSCFVAIWLPDGSQVMATAVGHGANLQNGKVGRLEIWDMELQKKVESHKATKAADDLGF
jgi:hypothetical protein